MWIGTECEKKGNTGMKDKKTADIVEMTVWLGKEVKKIETTQEPEKNGMAAGRDLPVLYSVITLDEESLDAESKKRYKKYLEKGKVGALAGGIAAASSALTMARGASVITGGGSALMVSPFLFSVGIGIAGTALVLSRIKPKNDRDVKGKCSEKLADIYDLCGKRMEQLIKKIEKNTEGAEILFEKYVPEALQSLKEAAEKTAIHIDDVLNVDQNKRIMQYQEIVLEEYRSQKELRETMEKIVLAYNALIKENKKLAMEIEQYKNVQGLCAVTNNEFLV